MTNRPANGPSPDRDDSAAASDGPAAALLAEVAATFAGTAPNIYRMLAANPAVLECFVRLEHLLERDGMLSAGEQAIVALIVADHADCRYCRAVFAKEVEAAGISMHVRRGIQQGKLPRERRLAAITHATRRILASHGRLGRAELGALERRGITRAELLELVAIIATYKLATYANNLARTRIDPEFR
jgi:alkylhydroperoxidase family enzyme